MTSLSVTRAGFLAALVGLSVATAAPDAYAARNNDAERYVQTNAAAALGALGNTNVSATERRQTFQRLMSQFADMPRIAIFVVGRYRGTLTSDASLRSDWLAAFQDFAIASYETQFENFGGSAIRVTGSVERIPGQDVIVDSELRPRSGAPMRVQWRVIRSGSVWKVVDVAAGSEQVWLAQFQQRQFLAQLDQNRGNIRALITDVRQQTASMRQTIARS